MALPHFGLRLVEFPLTTGLMRWHAFFWRSWSADTSRVNARHNARHQTRLSNPPAPMKTLPSLERYAAWLDNRIAGFVVINMSGTLAGYIQSICVAPGNRASGIGRLLMAHAETRIFRDTPNVFLMVSDFNAAARRFYERLGYRTIGEIPEYLVAGRSEILMRKTRGPIRGHPASSRDPG